MAGVTRPMMMSGMEKLRNWLNRSEKVAKTLPTGLGTKGWPPKRIEPRSRASRIAPMTQVRMLWLRRWVSEGEAEGLLDMEGPSGCETR